MTGDPRRFAPATARNREPILAVLRRAMPARANVLEIASGTGEHAVFLAPRLGVRSWQPTDPDPDARASIDAWRAQTAIEASSEAPTDVVPADVILAALDLDVTKRPWPPLRADAVVCINMIHIAPWRACEALVTGAGELLDPGGILYLYGPYRRDGAHTAPSNDAFDRSLRARDPSWGVRDLEAVEQLANEAGLSLEEVVPMPANNFSVVFRRS